MIWSAHGDSHASGTIKLDRTGNEAEWVESMSHELVHLCTFLAGRAADVHAMGREEFVTAKMDDEINAHAVSYVTQLQMGKATSTPAGYDEFAALFRRRHARTLAAEDWTAIEALARTFVTGKYDSRVGRVALGRELLRQVAPGLGRGPRRRLRSAIGHFRQLFAGTAGTRPSLQRVDGPADRVERSVVSRPG